MDDTNAVSLISLISDMGTVGLLLLILWQGLKRFDLLLRLVITLAARTSIPESEIEKIRAEAFGDNGKRKG